MNTACKHLIFLSYIIAIVTLALGSMVAQAETEPNAAAFDAMERLRVVANYSWIRSTDTPGAPFTIGPIQGRADTTGFAVQNLLSGGKTFQSVAKGRDAAVLVGDTWKSAHEILGSKDIVSVDVLEVLNAKTPVDEMALLLPKITILAGERVVSIKASSIKQQLKIW